MADNSATINVQMTLDLKGFKRDIALTEQQAQGLGNSIAKALELNVSKTVVELNKVTQAISTIRTSAVTPTNRAIKQMLDIKVTATNQRIDSITKHLKDLGAQAKTTNTALNKITFNIGDTNKKINRVIEKLKELEARATALSGKNINLSFTTTGDVPVYVGGRGGSRSVQDSEYNKKRKANDPERNAPLTFTKDAGENVKILISHYDDLVRADENLVRVHKKSTQERINEDTKFYQSLSNNIDKTSRKKEYYDRLRRKIAESERRDINLTNKAYEESFKLLTLRESTQNRLSRIEELQSRRRRRNLELEREAEVKNLQTRIDADKQLYRNMASRSTSPNFRLQQASITNAVPLNTGPRTLPRIGVGRQALGLAGDVVGFAIRETGTIAGRAVTGTIDLAEKAFNKFQGTARDLGQKTVNAFGEGFRKLSDVTENTATNSRSRFARLFTANFFADIAYNAIAGMMKSLQSLSAETVLYAARTEELGIVLNSLARVNNINTEEIIKQEQAVKSLNITTQDARETLSRFIAVGFDVKDAGPLARVAQDLAVLSGKNTSEALDGLVVAIQTLQSRNLRSQGVYLTVDEVLDRLSNTTGRARDSFSTLEKQQAVLNAVMQYGTRVAGTYEAAMTSASKQLRSMDRLFKEAQNAVGENFTPALEFLVEVGSRALELIAKYPDVITDVILLVGTLTTAIVGLRTQALQSLVLGAGNLASNLGDIAAVISGTPRHDPTALKKTALSAKITSIDAQEKVLNDDILAAREKIVATEQNLANFKKNNLAADIESETRIRNQQVALEKTLVARQANLAVTRQQAQAELSVLTGQEKGIGKFANLTAKVVGYIGLIGSVVALIYSIGDTIYQVATAPEDLKNIDVNLAGKIQKDLERNKQLATEYRALTSRTLETEYKLSGETASLEQQRLAIAKQLGNEGRAYLNILNSQKVATGDISRAIEVQTRSDEAKRDALLVSARANLSAALRNEGTKLQELGIDTNRYARLQDLITVAKERNIPLLSEKEITERSGAWLYSFDKAAYSVDELTKRLKDANLNPQGVELLDVTRNVQAAQVELADLSNTISLSSAEMAKFEAISQNSFEQLVKLSETFGTSVESEVEIVIQSLGKESLQAQKLREEYGKLIEIRNKALGEQITEGLSSPEELIEKQYQALQNLIKARQDSETEYFKAEVNRLNSFKDEAGNLPPQAQAELNKLLANQERRLELARESAIREFGSGQAGEQNRKKLASTLSDTLFNLEKEQGLKLDPVERALKLQEIARDFSTNNEKYNMLETAMGSTDERNDLLNFTIKLQDKLKSSKDVLEQATLELASIFSESDEVRKQYFQAEDNKRLASDIRKIQKLQYDLTGSTELNKGVLERDPKKVKAVLEDLERAEKRRNDLINARQKLEDAKDPNRELEVLNKQVALEEARVKLTFAQDGELRKLDIARQIVETETELYNLRQAPDPTLEKLQNQLKVEQDIKSFKDQQKEIENEIAVLKVTATLPAINAELIAEKAILETIQERKAAEQQLTADIAVEIVKRRNLERDSGRTVGRIAGEVFLERQRSEITATEDLIRNALSLQLSSGDDSMFVNNEFIKEAQRQSEKLAKIDQQGGAQLVATKEGNDIAKLSQEYLKGQINATDSVRNSVNNVNTSIVEGNREVVAKLEEISSKTGFGADFGLSGRGAGLDSKNSQGQAIIDLVKRTRVGATPLEIASLFGFESGGTYSPSKYGGDGGKYLGIFQAGPAEQKAYGVNSKQSFEEQVLAFERFITDRFRKAGVSLIGANIEQLYAAVLTGSPKNYEGKKDSNNTTVRGGVEKFLREHSPVAYRRFFSGKETVRYDTSSTLDAIEKKRIEDEKKTAEERAKTEAKEKELRQNFLEAQQRQYLGRLAVGATEISAVAEYVKSIEERTAALDKQEVQREILVRNELKERELALREAREERKKFVSDEGRGIGSAQRQAQLEALTAESASYAFRTGVDYVKALEEFDISKWQEFVELQKETLNLQLEQQFRTEKFESYRRRQAARFNNEQISQMHQIQDENEQLYLREQAYLDENSQYRKNILAQELLERRKSKQALTEEIDSLERYNTTYLFSEENRLRIAREADRDRKASYRDLIESMMRLDEDFGKANINLELELAKRQKEIRNAQENEYKDNLLRQLELENELRRKFQDPFNADEFRTRGLERLNSAVKSQTEIMADLFGDSFDAISGGFGSLIDKMTGQLGVFGGVIGNFLKGTFNRLIGGIFNDILNEIVPTNPLVSNTIANPNEALNEAINQMAGSTIVLSEVTVAGANQVATFGNVVGIVSNTLIEIVGTVVATVNSLLGQLGSVSGGGASVSIGGLSNVSGIVNSGKGSINGITGSVAHELAHAIPTGRPISGAETLSGGGVLSSVMPTVKSGAGGVTGSLLGQGTGVLKSLLSGKGLGATVGSFIAGAPFMAAGLGGLLGGGSGIGGALGQIGGLLGGVAGLGLLSSLGVFSVLGGTAGSVAGGATVGGLFGGGGLLGGLFGGGGLLNIAGLSAGLSATIVLAPIAGALLIGSYFLGRNKRRREEEKIRNQALLDAKGELEQLLRDVRTNKVDGQSAITRAEEIRRAYMEQMSQLKDSKTRKHALQSVREIDHIISQIKVAAAEQERRKELDLKIVPTYATGGVVGNGEVIRVSRGETMFYPVEAFANAGIPGFARGGYIPYKINGRFDGKDDILTRAPKGTIVANPRQVQRIKPRGLATGGVVGTVVAPTAQASYSASPPSVTAVIVFSEEEAQRVASQVPDAVIIGKVRRHVRKTGSSGLAGDVINTYK